MLIDNLRVRVRVFSFHNKSPYKNHTCTTNLDNSHDCDYSSHLIAFYLLDKSTDYSQLELVLDDVCHHHAHKSNLHLPQGIDKTMHTKDKQLCHSSHGLDCKNPHSCPKVQCSLLEGVGGLVSALVASTGDLVLYKSWYPWCLARKLNHQHIRKLNLHHIPVNGGISMVRHRSNICRKARPPDLEGVVDKNHTHQTTWRHPPYRSSLYHIPTFSSSMNLVETVHAQLHVRIVVPI